MTILNLVRGAIIALLLILILSASQRADDQAAEAVRAAQHG